MKIKHSIQLSLLLCSLHSQLWGMRVVEALRPEGNGGRENPFSDSSVKDDIIKQDYLEQQRLLHKEQAAQDAASAAKGAPKKSGKTTTALTQPVKKPAAPSDVAAQDSDTQDLTEHDIAALKEIGKEHRRLDEPQPVVGRTALNTGKTAFLLEQLFRAELKKRDSSLTETDINLLVKTLKTTMTHQLQSITHLTSPAERDIKLQAIRKEMNRLLTTANKELAGIKSKQALETQEAASKKAAADAQIKAAADAKKELENPTPLSVTTLPVPFRENRTQLTLTTFKNAVSFLREEKQALTPGEKRAINKIIETLNLKLDELVTESPKDHNWLRRKKWSKDQETEASAAIRAANAQLADFSAKQNKKAIFAEQVDQLFTKFKTDNELPDHLSDMQEKRASRAVANIKAEANTFIDSNQPTELPKLLEKLKSDLNEQVLGIKPTPKSQPEPVAKRAPLTPLSLKDGLEEELTKKGLTWDQTSEEVQQLHVEFEAIFTKIAGDDSEEVQKKNFKDLLGITAKILAELQHQAPAPRPTQTAEEQRAKETIKQVNGITAELTEEFKQRDLSLDASDDNETTKYIQSLKKRFRALQRTILRDAGEDQTKELITLRALLKEITAKLPKLGAKPAESSDRIANFTRAVGLKNDITQELMDRDITWNQTSDKVQHLHTEFEYVLDEVIRDKSEEGQVSSIARLEEITKEIIASLPAKATAPTANHESVV